MHSRSAAAILVALACAPAPTALAPLPAGGVHVLFIGNSLTYVNDLPATVEAIARSAGDTIRVMTVAGAGLALIDHLTGATQAVSAVCLGGWDYVVLQQGPTPAGICRDSLVLWALMFDSLIRENGGKPALFMTWPSDGAAAAQFDAVRISFEDAAIAVGGEFLPAGEAWRAAWELDASLQLYGADGFHPSALGSFVAALEIYERITHRDARTLSAQAFLAGKPFAVPDTVVRILQTAAHTANTQFPSPVVNRAITPSSHGAGVGHC